MVPAQARQNLVVRFHPEIPAFTSQATHLPSDLIVPENMTSALVFSVNGVDSRPLNLTGRVLPKVHLLNPFDVTQPPLVMFARSGSDYIVDPCPASREV